jgi:hypothetical protein
MQPATTLATNGITRSVSKNMKCSEGLKICQEESLIPYGCKCPELHESFIEDEDSPQVWIAFS